MAAILRLFHLGHQSLWVDEVLTWGTADIGGRFTIERLLENVHGPLYSLMLHGWGRLAGDSEWALRLPSALLGVALVAATAWLAARWLGAESVVPAAWLAAGSPFLVWYAQEARNYTMLMLCTALSGVALLALRRRIALAPLGGYLAAAAAGLLSNFSFAMLAPLHLAWWLGDPGRRFRRLAIAVGALLVLGSALLPWLPQIRGTWAWSRLHPQQAGTAVGEPLRGGTTFHAGALPFALHSFAVGYTFGPSLRELRAEASLRTLAPHLPWLAAEALVFASLGGLGLVALARRRRLTEGLLWLVVPALVVSYFAMQNFKVFHPRYLAVSAPGFLIVLAAAFADLKPRPRVVLAAAVALLWALALYGHYFDPRYAKEDTRSAARLLRERAVAGEKIIAGNAEEPLFYYYRGPLPIERFWLGFAARPDRMRSKFEQAIAGASGAWVVLSRPEDLDPRGAFAGMLDHYSNTQRFSFTGVRVWHLGADARLMDGWRGAGGPARR